MPTNPMNDNVEEVVYQYGPYLRGSPKNRSRISAVERKKEVLLMDKYS